MGVRRDLVAGRNRDTLKMGVSEYMVAIEPITLQPPALSAR
jgi:hypothetical protein